MIDAEEKSLGNNYFYDQNALGKFPLYIWIIGYACKDLQIEFGYNADIN